MAFATTEATVTAGDDYTETSGTLTLESGDTTKTVAVPIVTETEWTMAARPSRRP